MRGNHLRRFTLLQCCLLAALLIHAALLVSFRYVPVAGGLVTYVAREIGLVEVTINLNPRPQPPTDPAAVGGSASGGVPDVPAAGRLGPPSGTEPVAGPTELPAVVPRADAAGAARIEIAVAPPKSDAPSWSPVGPSVAPVVVPQAAPVDVRLDRGSRVQQVDQYPPVDSARPVERTWSTDAAVPARPTGSVPAELPVAAADPSAGSLAVAPSVTPRPAPLISPRVVGTSPVPTVPSVVPSPEIAGPRPGAAPFAGHEPTLHVTTGLTPSTRPSASPATRPADVTIAAGSMTPLPSPVASGDDNQLPAAPAVGPRAIVTPVGVPVQPPAVVVAGIDPGRAGVDIGPPAITRPNAGPNHGLGLSSTGHQADDEVTPLGQFPRPVIQTETTGARTDAGRPAARAPVDLPRVRPSVPPPAGPTIFQPVPAPPTRIPDAPPVVAAPPVAPRVTVTPPPTLTTPPVLAQRSPEQRRRRIEQLGGTKASETAVDRGLAYLARVQEPDGRWSHVAAGGRKPGRPEHDAALTGLAVLAFLAADHSPARDGPYRDAVARGVDWIVANQTFDGDLRGPQHLRGGGSAKANMYDHGIATMAVAEAALMTGEKRYAHAATRAAFFICDVQNKQTGGWRYQPGEPGDTSVFGWQVMALHNAELVGFRTPPEVQQRAIKYLSMVSSGRSRVLAGYAPGEGPSPAMTAEALFCRVLLGQPIDGPQAAEAVEYLSRELPASGRADLYYWYYASLSLSQLQANPQVRRAWDRWNERCRDTLVATQAKGGDQDGSWTDPRWGEHGGTVFATALATLTLEVYYRYLPLQPGDPAAARAAWQAAEPGPAPAAKPRGPVGPKLEAN